MEEAVLTGVATDKSEAKVTVLGISDKPGEAAKVFRALADAEINIDMVLQNVFSVEDGTTDITFTCPRSDGRRAMEILKKLQVQGNWTNVLYDDQVGKVSLVGAGMKSHPGVTAEFMEALRDVNVNIELISTSEIRISVLIREDDLDAAARALHEQFQLGGEDEAVVYAGTGRHHHHHH
uniref:Aspartokinase n=1 Tax=Corynebacterium glutamicum TaxID=1718 RepID=UPI0001D8E4B7|nr:Chain B, Aspartokinase [Corynebacterium glutamicum]3AB4_D Chain D, Aspartokinase [Corynebacterium glutamicum]3AB4_F Chain F, Aspartokinase [Corynebacterium glutamicum]3AB4_H Chain H, Aspartokinase [Corynebacterium glutamicum]3AB4_J Chain J, Aspartokinase [Corynebacterium glutamicum]3AB4_L Chain L, Aspartokinase [Corynebacterium glutamicum]3AB4_N Chain N, Aspartokinase [Corynebacterium glutamicum]3AB4_P Chain P, Aspartokinase [Corynebacterium glutamicum]